MIEESPAPPPPADTEIQFDETTNLGAYCGGPLTSWQVTNEQTGEVGTAGCQQPVLFAGLAPNASYTFDVVGWSGSRTCWQGTCAVYAERGVLTYADCSPQIAHLCGY